MVSSSLSPGLGFATKIRLQTLHFADIGCPDCMVENSRLRSWFLTPDSIPQTALVRAFRFIASQVIQVIKCRR